MGWSGPPLERALAAWEETLRAKAGAGAAARLAAELLEAGAALGGEAEGPLDPERRALGHAFLEATGVPAFLRALDGPAARARWAEVALAAVRGSDYTLETMLEHRARTLGAHALFEEFGRPTPARWSYSRVHARARSFAAALLAAGGESPRVALFLDNGVDGACCDLACLLHDILVTPLSIHFGVEELAWIFDRLRITVAISDSEDRLHRLLDVRRRVRVPFRLFALHPNRVVDRGDAGLFGAAVAGLDPAETEAILAGRRRLGPDDPCTVMFTSGSTGRPKGVVFTRFNVVSKRFARAAALPDVGEDEKLLCYLPLFHTFGRYLEMLGMLFWRGTYVFAGNPSAETLLAGLPQVRPTGLIGIPLRWVQIHDRTLEAMRGARTAEERAAAFRGVVGDRLRWGLSAAGYLDRRVFQHFHRHGVELCSGFGMTEASGGITMSPPGAYVPHSVGLPLPAIRVRLLDSGEMHIAGPYVARYLVEDGDDLERAGGPIEDGTEWMPTGDVFKRIERGHLTLVDRVKDIYKNDRGQTIAPNRVEQKFLGVPGIRRTFLVGDHRSYNVLLIVPDLEDPVLKDAPGGQSHQDYFHQIVAAANEDLAPYERVVNFAVVDRDFDVERGELTSKGSYRRKNIEHGFATVIDALYERPWVEYQLPGVRARLPRWFFRDVGVLENDIRAADGELVDRRRGLRLPLRREPEASLVRVGDLDYRAGDGPLDLGAFARQPRLWIANPALIRFAPCKIGWDVGLGPVSDTPLLPRCASHGERGEPVDPPAIDDLRILEVNRLLQTALYAGTAEGLAALDRLSRDLVQQDDRLGTTIRRRIAALARHDDEAMRCLAYRVLLLDDALPEFGDAFPAFVESGLSFLNRESIEAIAVSRFEQRRLQALRRRLFDYRARLRWPAGEVVRQQFAHLMGLLVGFVHSRPEYYRPVRAELTSWVLHRSDPALAALAAQLLEELAGWFEARLAADARPDDARRVSGSVQVDEEIGTDERRRLGELLSGTTFLRQSILLAFDDPDFELGQVREGGIWVSRLLARGPFQMYRVSVNTMRHRHYDLLVVLRDDMDAEAVLQTNYWMVAIGDHPRGGRTLPRFGCMRPELAAMSLEYVRDLTVADQIRELAGGEQPEGARAGSEAWRKLFVRGLATIVRAWNHSDRRIVPGALDPSNVVVPETDWREDALLLSLAGWEPCSDTLSLFVPMHRSFYRKTMVLYPSSARVLNVDWMFDACVEVLGAEPALEVLRQFRSEAQAAEAGAVDETLLESLGAYLARFDACRHRPLALDSAIGRYAEWCRVNPGATAEARVQLLDQLLDLYHLRRLGEIARYRLYRHTYFAGSSEGVRAAFDRLLDALAAEPGRSATQRVELSDLQAAVEGADDRAVFARLVFPQARRGQPLEVVAFGDSEHRQATVRTRFVDARGDLYDLREPMEPEEIGQLYRLIYQERFPKRVSELDRHLVATDATGRVVGGACYWLDSAEVAHLDCVVVNAAVSGRGLATALLEDFANRVASRGVKVLRTSFFMRPFCERHGFRLDRRWGGLVRFLVDEAAADEGDVRPATALR